MKPADLLETQRQLIKVLEKFDYDDFTPDERKGIQQIAERLAARANEFKATVDRMLTPDEQALLERAQALWRLYAPTRRRNRDAPVHFEEWVQRYEADGIALAPTLEETVTWLEQQTHGLHATPA